MKKPKVIQKTTASAAVSLDKALTKLSKEKDWDGKLSRALKPFMKK